MKYKVKMMVNEDVDPVLIHENFTTEAHASTMVNGIVEGLAIAKFRGAARFLVANDEVAVLSAVVTFTDDMPNGHWSVNRS